MQCARRWRDRPNESRGVRGSGDGAELNICRGWDKGVVYRGFGRARRWCVSMVTDGGLPRGAQRFVTEGTIIPLDKVERTIAGLSDYLSPPQYCHRHSLSLWQAPTTLGHFAVRNIFVALLSLPLTSLCPTLLQLDYRPAISVCSIQRHPRSVVAGRPLRSYPCGRRTRSFLLQTLYNHPHTQLRCISIAPRVQHDDSKVRCVLRRALRRATPRW